jgi:hypothetical protein
VFEISVVIKSSMMLYLCESIKVSDIETLIPYFFRGVVVRRRSWVLHCVSRPYQ